MIEGNIPGRKGEFDCPIELKYYGTSDPADRIRLVARMKDDRLPLGDLKKREKEEKEKAKLAAKAAKLAKRGGGAIVGGSAGAEWNTISGEYAASSQGLGFTQSLDDIIAGSEQFNPRNIEQLSEKLGVSERDLEEMPKAEQPRAVATKLLPYQLQGLKWLLQKESPQMPPVGSEDSAQLWKRSDTDANSFINLAVNFQVRNQVPRLASGGILADDMGLGKTLQMISLIMADRELRPSQASGTCAATLIISPLSVMSNWAQQIKRHLHPDQQLKVLTYHGTRKQPINPKTINDYDIVITTYGICFLLLTKYPIANKQRYCELGFLELEARSRKKKA